MIYFTSDLHFGHKNVIRFCDRPYKDLDHMECMIINKFNETVGPEDTTYFLGDIFFYSNNEKIENVLSRMNGRKILIRGNHDRKGPNSLENLGFDLVLEEAKIKLNGKRIILSHYPYWLKDDTLDTRYEHRRPQDMGEWLLHGHTHDSKKINLDNRMIHVGIDAWNRPVSESEISSLIAKAEK